MARCVDLTSAATTSTSVRSLFSKVAQLLSAGVVNKAASLKRTSMFRSEIPTDLGHSEVDGQGNNQITIFKSEFAKPRPLSLKGNCHSSNCQLVPSFRPFKLVGYFGESMRVIPASLALTDICPLVFVHEDMCRIFQESTSLSHVGCST